MKKKMKKASYGMKKKMRGGDYMEPDKELKFGGPRKRAQMGEKGFTQPIKATSSNSKKKAVKDDKLSAQLAAESAKIAITPSGPKKVEQKKSSGGGSYAQAKKNNPNLDKLISQRKGLKKGTSEYNAVQNKINKAYGKGPTNRPTAKPAEKPKAAPAPMKTKVKPVSRAIKTGPAKGVTPEALSKGMAETGLKQAGERLQKSKTSQASPTTKKESRIMSRADKKVGKIQDRRAKAAGRKEERQDRKEGRRNRRSAVKEARGTKRAAIRKARGKGADMKEALKGASPGWPSGNEKKKYGGPRKKAVAGAAIQAGGAALQGLGKITDAIAGKETKFGKIAGAVGQTAGTIGGMTGGIPGNPAGSLINKVPAGQGGGGQAPAADPAAAGATGQPDMQQVKKGGKKRKKHQEGGGKMEQMKKKNVTGVNAKMASGRDIRGSKPVISKVTGTTDSKKGGDSGSSNDYKMGKSIKGTESFAGKTYMTLPKNVMDMAKGKGLTKKQQKRRGPAPMKTGGPKDAKPDYLDFDKDGNKTEPMKSALPDRRSKAKRGRKK